MSVALRTKSVFIVGLLFFSILSSMSIGNPMIASIETESSPLASGYSATSQMVKPSKVDFSSDAVMISDGTGSHSPLAIDVYHDLICHGGFFSGELKIGSPQISFNASGDEGFVYCKNLQGDFGMKFTSQVGEMAKIQDLVILDNNTIATIGTFVHGSKNSFITVIDISQGLDGNVVTTSTVINHCNEGGLRQFEVLKIDGILSEQHIIGEIRNHGSDNRVCTSSTSKTLQSGGSLDFERATSNISLDISDNKSFLIEYSADLITDIHLPSNNNWHFTSVDTIQSGIAYVSYHDPSGGTCNGYYTQAGYKKWEKASLSTNKFSLGSNACGENLKFRDIAAASVEQVYLIGDASNLASVYCYVGNDCTGIGGLDVVVYDAYEQKGILLGGKLLDYGFSISNFGSELIIAGSFESSSNSLGISSIDEEDGFVGSIKTDNLSINWANRIGGHGIDLVTNIAIESNNNVHLAAIISGSGRAGSVDYVVPNYENFKTKSFVGMVNTSDILPVPKIHKTVAMNVKVQNELLADIQDYPSIHYLGKDDLEVVEYRLSNTSGLNITNIEVKRSLTDSSMYINQTSSNTSTDEFVSVFLIKETEADFPYAYLIAQHPDNTPCSLDKNYLTFHCRKNSSSNYFTYSESHAIYNPHDSPRNNAMGSIFWSKHIYDGNKEFALCEPIKNSEHLDLGEFSHIDNVNLVFSNSLGSHIYKYNLQSCTGSAGNSGLVSESTISTSFGIKQIVMNENTQWPTFLIQSNNKNRANSNCVYYEIQIHSLSTLNIEQQAYDINFCSQSSTTDNHLGISDVFFDNDEILLISSFEQDIQIFNISKNGNELFLYEHDLSKSVSMITGINMSSNKINNEAIYSDTVTNIYFGKLSEGVSIVCLKPKRTSDTSLGEVFYSDDFSNESNFDSMCLAIGQKSAYSFSEFDSMSIAVTNYGALSMGGTKGEANLHDHIYSFINTQTPTNQGVTYDGRRIFVDYNTAFSLQFEVDRERKTVNQWTMTPVQSGTSPTWLSLNESGLLSGTYNIHTDLSSLPCLDYIVKAESNISQNHLYNSWYSHLVQICVQSVPVTSVVYGTDNNLRVRYDGNQHTFSPQYDGGPVSDFVIQPISNSTQLNQSGVSIHNETGDITLDTYNLVNHEGNYIVSYSYSHNGNTINQSFDINVSMDYEIDSPSSVERQLTGNIGGNFTFDMRDSAIIDQLDISFEPTKDNRYICSTLNTSSFTVDYNPSTKQLTVLSNASSVDGCEDFGLAGNLTIQMYNFGAVSSFEITFITEPDIDDYDVIYPNKEVGQIFGAFTVSPQYKNHNFSCLNCSFQLDPSRVYRAGISVDSKTGVITYVAHNGAVDSEKFTVLISYPNVSSAEQNTRKAVFNLTTLPVQPDFTKDQINVEIITGQSIYYPAESPGISNPLDWSISAGSLPIGLSIEPNTGVITGVTNDIGSHTVNVQAKSTKSDHLDYYSLTLDVIAPPSEAHYSINHVNVFGDVDLTPIKLQNDVNRNGSTWNHTITELNSAGVWSERSGGYPGLIIDERGNISGIPMWDDNSLDDKIEIFVNLTRQWWSADKPSIQITINKPIFQKPSFDQRNIEITTIKGTEFSFSPPAPNAQVSNWFLNYKDDQSSSDFLGSGLRFDSDTGSIYGTSEINAENMQLTITAVTNMQQSGSFDLNITVLNPALETVYYPHTTLHLLEGVEMEPLVPITPYHKNLNFSGILPQGLDVDSSTGVISGIPSIHSNVTSDSDAIYEIYVDEPHVSEPATLEIVIHIHDPLQDFKFALNSTNVSFVVGEPINFELQFPGSTSDDITWSLTSLPSQLSLIQDGNRAFIRGNPINLGLYSVNVEVLAAGARANYTQLISIVEKDPVLHYEMDKFYLHLGQDLNAEPICPDYHISISRYEITPWPSNSMVFDTKSGCISGSPHAVSISPSTYSIRGITDSDLSTTFELDIIVNGFRADYFLIDNPAIKVIDQDSIMSYTYQEQFLKFGESLVTDTPNSMVGQLSQFTIYPSIQLLGSDLNFNQSTGILSGKPDLITPEGGITFVINATWQYTLADGTLLTTNVSTDYHISVESGELIYVRTQFVKDKELSIQPTAGYSGYDEYILYGRLPNGVIFDTETGSFSGTPREYGNFSFHVIARDLNYDGTVGSSVDYYVEFEVLENDESNPWAVVTIFAMIGLLFTVRRFIDERKELIDNHSEKNFSQNLEEE